MRIVLRSRINLNVYDNPKSDITGNIRSCGLWLPRQLIFEGRYWSAELVDCGSLFHCVMVLAEYFAAITLLSSASLAWVASPLVTLGFLSRPRSAIGTATWLPMVLNMNMNRLTFLPSSSVPSWRDWSIVVTLKVRLWAFFIQRTVFLCNSTNMVCVCPGVGPRWLPHTPEMISLLRGMPTSSVLLGST